jgi:hypothetical protein
MFWMFSIYVVQMLDPSSSEAVQIDVQMWIYGGWNDELAEALNDMHVLKIGEMRWEQIQPGGHEMEARAWHSVCLYKDHMLLYGDKGECVQSQSNMTTVFAFDFKTRTWGTIPCTGVRHNTNASCACVVQLLSMLVGVGGPVHREHALRLNMDAACGNVSATNSACPTGPCSLASISKPQQLKAGRNQNATIVRSFDFARFLWVARSRWIRISRACSHAVQVPSTLSRNSCWQSQSLTM